MANDTNEKNLLPISITEEDLLLIEKVRNILQKELKLVPAYDDNTSLLRWLIGWERNIDVVVEKLQAALTTIYCLGLTKQNFSTIEKITTYCDQCTKSSLYMPGSMIGFDKEGNVVSLQVVGQLDGHGILKSTMISDLFLMRIAESEGVMELIRQGEKKSNKMLGTVLIIDLEGLSIEKLDYGFIKLITTLLAQLQDLFPDVLKKVFIIRSPSFLQLLWSAIQPVLAKQTQQKIHFLSADWKIQLQQNIGEDLLYSHWGGNKHSVSKYGDIRMGGKIPVSMYYDLAKDPFYDSSKATKISIGPKKFVTIDLTVEEENEEKELRWWWRCESGDLDFYIVRLDLNSGTTINEVSEPNKDIVWPKFRLLTEHVPECRKLLITKHGVYRMCLENLHGKFWNKKVEYRFYVI